jgi:hypothetical protein
MTEELWPEKNLEGNGGINEVLSRRLPEWKEENHDKSG